MSHDECFLILGGAGLVGKQIARRIADELQPRKIVIASLFRHEVKEAIEELRDIFSDQSIEWEGVWGNIFVRSDYAQEPRPKLLESYERRETLYQDLFGAMDYAYEASLLVQIIRQHRPNVIVDSINTATAISYQDIETASVVAKREFDALTGALRDRDFESARQGWKDKEFAFELLLLSQSLPQLVRHVQMLHRAMVEVGTRLYLKIGTTGTGGMGLNIPYTHSEDKPSSRLMTKTAVAFAHTGLMFLMARTPAGPIVKEIKPGAMIGYADVTCRTIKERGAVAYLYSHRSQPLNGRLVLRENPADYQQLAELDLPVVDTGENGLFTRGEFEAITALRQMEFVTPEEIARESVLEIKGSNTGRDVIAAIDGAVMNPSYRAGYLRQQVLDEMKRLEEETGAHSVALGQLGPPELSKLLWEAELLKIEYGTLQNVLVDRPADIAERLYACVQADDRIARTITSIGLPILVPDGSQLIRGPRIRIPEIPGENEVELTPEAIDRWAAKGWLDLRPENIAAWQTRFQHMERARNRLRGRGSAAITREAYLFGDIRIGEIVGWIFNNEQAGYRIK